MKKLFFGFLLVLSGLLWGCSDNAPDGDNPLSGMPYTSLSEYNFFTGNLADLEPAPGVIGYDLTTPLFTDYAQKARFIVVPDGQTVPYNDMDFLEFPVGTILVKNFYYADDLRNPTGTRKIIETRLLVHFEEGWDAFPYIWNNEQTDAIYTPVGGKQTISWFDEQGTEKTIDYVVPNINDCKGCHNLDNRFSPIGPKARLLNRDFDYAAGTMNILDKLASEGILTGLPEPSERPVGVVWNDPSTASLEERARTYLDINCGHCHRPEGPANHSGLFLYKHETDPFRLGFCKKPVAAGNGSGGLNYDIVAGNADQSIVHFRMSSTEPGVMMPELGRTINHDEGIALVREWINSLPAGNCN